MRTKITLAFSLSLAFSANQLHATTPAALITLPAVNADGDAAAATGITGATFVGNDLFVLSASTVGSELLQVNSPSDVSVVMDIVEFNTDGPGGFASTGNFLGAFADGTFVFPTIVSDSVFTVDSSGQISTLSPSSDIATVTGDSSPFIQYSSVNSDSDAYYFFNNSTAIGESGFYRITQSGVETELVDNSVLQTLGGTGGVNGDFDVEGLAVTGPAGSETIYYGSNDFDSLYVYEVGSGTGSKILDLNAALGGSAGVSTAFVLGDDGLLYFYETGTDSIYSIDPDASDVAASLEEAFSSAQLTALVGSDTVNQLLWTPIDGGTLGFVTTSGGGGGTIGVYVIPEPTTAALVGLVGLGLLGRRRSA